MIRRTLAAFAAAACAAAFAGHAAAAPVKVGDAQFAERESLAGQTLTLNGAGMRKILFIKVYAAGLYVGHPGQNAQALVKDAGPRLVKLVLARDVDGKDFVKALDEGLADNLDEKALEALKTEVEALHAIMEKIGDVKEGDTVDFEYVPGQGTLVKLNGKTVGEAIAGKPLFDAVLSIWIGEKPIDGSLKESLLKKPQ